MSSRNTHKCDMGFATDVPAMFLRDRFTSILCQGPLLLAKTLGACEGSGKEVILWSRTASQTRDRLKLAFKVQVTEEKDDILDREKSSKAVDFSLLELY